ncbi:MAG: MerR family transcriptional regulator [Lachnospiraceae bacterium]|nr:MerR family transcriptional regulator [Lachnospiraceae bacterium]
MRISEVAKETGLSVSNIRFYEKKGLLFPEREDGSKYRNYQEKDLAVLKQIILYRKMNISVEMIYMMQNGEISMQNVLQRNLEELKEQRERLDDSIDLCSQILNEPDLDKINIDYYLNYVRTEEEQGRKFALVEEFLEDAADFYGISKFQSDPYIGKFLSKKWVKELLSFAWLIFCIGFPIRSIISKIIVDGTIELTSVVFWVCWFFCMVYPFYRFKKKSR